MKARSFLILLLVVFISNISFSQSWISSTSPSKNQLNVSRSTGIEITFNRAMLSSSFSSSNIKINGEYKGQYTISFSYNASAKKLTINPSQAFMMGEYVTVSLGATIKDSANNSIPNSYNYSFTCAVNGGKGTFTQSSGAVIVGGGPYKIISGDFDKNGKIDLAVLDSNKISILKNDGTGNFTLSSTLNIFSGANDMVSGDVDGDGNIDIVVTDQWQNRFYFLKNNGSGVFTSSGFYASGGSRPFHIALCNLDGDCSPDIIVTNWNSDAVCIFRNNGIGVFSLVNTLSNLGTRPRPIGTGDFDSDGLIDLAIGIDWSPPLVVILKNNGNFIFTISQSVTVRDRPYSIISNDYNGDGTLDLSVSDFYDNTIALLSNSGNGLFYPNFISTGGSGARCVIQGDYDKNGTIDLSIGSQLANLLTVLKNNGSGQFTGLIYSNVFGTPGSTANGDFDNDGDLDIAAANSNTGNVSFFKNDNSIGILPISSNTPADYMLGQNFPNPFNPMTSFDFSIVKSGNVLIELYDIKGFRIKTLFDGYKSAGVYRFELDASDLGLTSGVYFYRIYADGFTDAKKMILLK